MTTHMNSMLFKSKIDFIKPSRAPTIPNIRQNNIVLLFSFFMVSLSPITFELWVHLVVVIVIKKWYSKMTADF